MPLHKQEVCQLLPGGLCGSARSAGTGPSVIAASIPTTQAIAGRRAFPAGAARTAAAAMKDAKSGDVRPHAVLLFVVAHAGGTAADKEGVHAVLQDVHVPGCGDCSASRQ